MNLARPTALAALLASSLLTTPASAGVVFTDGVTDEGNGGNLLIGNRDSGRVDVSGTGLITNRNTIYLGVDFGSGELNISGGSVSAAEVYFGQANGSGGASVSGGSLNANIVGWNGGLTISGTGAVNSADSILGYDYNTDFGAFVSGGSWINSGRINVGLFGNGYLGISGTGLVQASSVMVAEGDGSRGDINLGGGTLRSGQVEAGTGNNSIGNSNLSFNGGKLQLSANQAALFNGYAPGNVRLEGAGGTIDTQGFTVATAQALTGDGVLTKQGNGSLTLTGENTYTGGTTVAAGTLQIGAGGTSGSLVGNIVNNGALVFNRSDDLTVAGILSGTGSLTKMGAGVLSLTNQNSYTGTTTVDAGTLTIAGAVNGPGGLVTVANGATLGGSGKLYRDVSVGATGQISSLLKVFGQVTLGNQANVGDVSSGTITADAGQQLVIGNATGGTINTTAGTASIATLNGASLTTGNLGATVETLVSGNITTNGGALVARAGSFGGAISGGGGLTKAGPGTLTLTGASDYTGGTFVAGGLILVNNSIGSGLGTGEVAVGGGGTLGGGGIISGPTAIGSGGTLAPGNSPGLLTLGSSLTLAGGSTSVFEINGAGRGTTYDAIDVAGLTTYGGTLSLVFGSTIAGGTTLDLFGLGGGEVESFSAITASGDYTGAFVNNSGIWTLLNGGQTLTFTESSGDLLVTGVAVPEPSAAAALAGVGTLAFAALRRRRRSK